MRSDLPTGTVTFLFTDVEGSTRLLHELGADAYAEALAEHRRVIRDACVAEGGVEVDTQGDAFFFAFPTAPRAMDAAAAFTSAFAGGPIQVRIGVHTGEPRLSEEGYVGKDVHFAARVAATGHGGQIIVSAATATLVDVELTDLGEHRLKDIAEAVQLFQLGEGSFPPLKTTSNTNLPRPASSFVGRDAELAGVLSKINEGARLLTLTGPGGSGKTRLAIEAAATLVPQYKAGVFWVGLASLRDPTLVTETIAQTLGAKDGLAEHIGEREMLLLLDNLEQVIECAPELASLLETGPNVTLLVTSRELLRVRGEVEYPVPSLAEPDAVALFCERSGLDPSAEISELCARPDSLPLAVELAAARTKALTPVQIVERLSQRLDLLKGGRDSDPRQQTLRATIEWSYELLSDEEQRLFARLSVFAGGSTLEAAEEVVEADLDTLQSLVEKSLLRFTDGRYWMLETIREFASERLVATKDASSTEGRHVEYFVRLAESLGLAVESYEKGSPARHETAQLEQHNLRAAIDWSHGSAPELGLRLAVALEMFWVAHNPYEGARTLEALVEDIDAVSPELRARAFRVLGGSYYLAGELEQALPNYERSLQLYEVLGNEWGIVHMRHRFASVALAQGDWARAQGLLEENLLRARALGSRYLEGEALGVLGAIADHDGDLERALGLSGESLAIARALGFHWREAIDLGNLADFALKLGRHDDAERYARDGLELSCSMHDRLTTVQSLGMLALVARARGEAGLAGLMWGAIEAEELRAPLGRWSLYREDYARPLLELAGPEFELGRRAGRAQPLERTIERVLAS